VLIIVHVYVCVKLFTFFDLYFVYFLQYSDTVGWVFWPVKTVGRITYIVLAQTLNHAQPQPWGVRLNKLEANGQSRSRIRELEYIPCYIGSVSLWKIQIVQSETN